MRLSDDEILAKLREGFSDDYLADFGTLICYQKEPLGEAYCPACGLVCNKHTGHKKCRETYVRSEEVV